MNEGKQMKRIHFLVTLVFIALLFPAIHIKANAVTSTAIIVEPQKIENLSVGATFTINLTVIDVQNFFTWQTKLSFNSTVLNCTKAAYPSAGGIFTDHSIIPVSPKIDNVGGNVTHGASLIGADSASGTGVMCQITFQVVGVGTSDLNFSTPYGKDTFLLDGDLNEIPTSIQNGFFTNAPKPQEPKHDIVVTDLTLSDTKPKEGTNVTISVDVLNNGTVSETFDVQISCDTHLIDIQTVSSLAAGSSKILTVACNTSGVSLGLHTVTANATVVPGETEIANNVKTVAVTVTSSSSKSTDLNGDGIVDMKDIGEAAQAFGTQEGDRRWNPDADINGDGRVDLIDMAMMSKDFQNLIL